MESTSSLNSASLPVVVGTIGVGLITIVSCSYFFRKKCDNNVKEKESQPTAGLQSTGASEPAKPMKSTTVNDVWEERRQRGIQAASLHTKKDITGKKEKPFGSSYYYAHNSTKTTGGYKDGLTMEDFTMNGPRLLSRNGNPVVDDDPLIESQQPKLENTTYVDANHAVTMKCEQPRRRIIPVSKYLWDDPGNSDGIATIRVDTLATYKANCSEVVEWKMIRPFVTSIEASLTGVGKEKDGLYVKIQALFAASECISSSEQIDSSNQSISVEYVLQIQKLYGHVQKVECISKDKRLLVRLYKQSAVFDKSNLKSWPHPQKKTA